MVVAFTGGETWNAKLPVIPAVFTLAVVGALPGVRNGQHVRTLVQRPRVAISCAFHKRGTR